MRQTFTVQAKAIEKIINAATAHDVSPAHLYAAVKIDPSVLLDPDNRIPFAQLVALYEKAAELTGDDDFGLHLGQTINPTAFDVVGYCALNSPTLAPRSRVSLVTIRFGPTARYSRSKLQSTQAPSSTATPTRR